MRYPAPRIAAHSTRLLEAGISPPLVMKISGHTQQKTFLRYVNQSEQSVFEIALKLDAAA